MADKPIEERVAKLEAIASVQAADHEELRHLVADLARSTREGFDQVAAQFRETDRRIAEMRRDLDERMRQTDERMRQTDERMRQTDERIERLVSAIGQFISQRPQA